MTEAGGRLDISENSRKVLERRYLKKDKSGKAIETPAEMFRRVAQNIAKADQKYGRKADLKKAEDAFYSIMSKLEFLPNSPTLMNAGKDLQLQRKGYRRGAQQVPVGQRQFRHGIVSDPELRRARVVREHPWSPGRGRRGRSTAPQLSSGRGYGHQDPHRSADVRAARVRARGTGFHALVFL